MIYFVVAQRNEDGKWDLFGPWENVEEADSKIAKLIDFFNGVFPQYSQVELARVLTDEDNPDRAEWLNRDKYEPLEDEHDNEKG